MVQAFIATINPSIPIYEPVVEDPDIGMDVDEAATDIDTSHFLPSQDGVDLSLATRIIRHLKNDTLKSGRAKAFAQGTSLIFSYICDLLNIDRSEINMKNRSAKRDLFNAIIHSVSLSPYHMYVYSHGIQDSVSRKPRNSFLVRFR